MTNLIVLEGIDCSGKTSVAKAIAKKMNYQFEHEPTFSSAYADSMNFGKLNAFQREFHFMIDRYKHQEALNNKDVVLDRYRLSGAVYASVFGNEALRMVHSIYMLPEFKKPTVTIFLDMPPEYAFLLNEDKKGTPEYSEKLTIDTLTRLRDAYFEQIDFVENYWKEKIIIVRAIYGNFDATVNNVLSTIQEAIK